MGWDFETDPAGRDGDEWVLNGHKWFTTKGSAADFLVVMCVTGPASIPTRDAR